MSAHETPAPEPGGQAATDEVADGDGRMAELEDSWRRTAAELQNLRKRCAQDVARARDQERASAASLWLPVLDNLERALEHAASDSDRIIDGVRSLHQLALDVLADLGYPRRDDEIGKPFDPARHEAIGTVADADHVPGTVAHVVRAGYGRDGQILRPASVIVATRGE